MPERKKAVEEAAKADKAAGKNLAEKEKALDKAEKRADAAEEKHKGEPRNWTLVPERLKRLAKGVAVPAVELWKKILAGLSVGALARGVRVRGSGSAPSSRTSARNAQLGNVNKRHFSLRKLLESRKIVDNNTIKIDDFDMQAEVDSIRAGEVPAKILSDGTLEYEVNGRKYGAHSPEDGVGLWPVYPKSGPGLLNVKKDVAKACRVLLDLKKAPQEAVTRALRKFEQSDIDMAREILQNHYK